MNDLRSALRQLVQDPGFTAVAVLTLALGIGVSAAVFSVADGVLLRPLPYPNPGRLVAIWETRPADGRNRELASPGNLLDWQSRVARFEAIAAWQDGSGASTLRVEGRPLVVETVKVTPAFFRLLGTPALLGRGFDEPRERGAAFNAADRYAGGDRVLVMSHAFWASHFGADPGVIGRSVVLDGVPWQVVGVMPDSLALPRATTQLFLPWDVEASFREVAGGPPRDLRFLNVLARLFPGASRAEAEAELQAVAASLAAAHPLANDGWSVRLSSLHEEIAAPARPAVLLLCGSRGTRPAPRLRQPREPPARPGRRAAARDGRAPFTRRLATAGSCVSSSRRASCSRRWEEPPASSSLGSRSSRCSAAAPAGLPGLSEARLDVRALLFVASLSVLTALAFGLAPALDASRAEVAGTLLEGGRSQTTAPRVRRLRRLLVAGEVAATLVLLAGAGLLGRSFLRVLAVDPGFDPRGLATLRVSLDQGRYQTGAHARAFYLDLMPRLAALPGVEAAGAVTALPLSPTGTDFSRPWWREGEADPGTRAATADIRMATPGYFDALRMTVQRGRGFSDADGDAVAASDRRQRDAGAPRLRRGGTRRPPADPRLPRRRLRLRDRRGRERRPLLERQGATPPRGLHPPRPEPVPGPDRGRARNG